MKIKSLFILVTLIISIRSSAQLLWLEGGLDIFHIDQKGLMYVPQAVDPAFVSPVAIDRGLTHFGIIVEGFYPINFTSPTFERFATGPVFGFSLTNGRKKLSYDPAYSPDPAKFFNNGTGNFRMPLLWSIRTGNMRDPETENVGFEVAAGMQFIHINTADEKGWAALPGVRGAIQYRRFSFAVNYYLLNYTSYYNVNGEEIERLKNVPISFEFKYAYDLFLGPVD